MTKQNNPISYQLERPILFKHLEFVGDVLDVGCNAGANINFLKRNYDNVGFSMGLDYNDTAINVAKETLSIAQVCNFNDLEQLSTILSNKSFNTIIIADVLEHLLYPKQVVEILYSKLKPNGKIIISLPNTGYYATLFHFFRRKWPRNERGIYDKTHIQFFFKRNLQDIVPVSAEYKLINRTFKLVEYKSVFLDKIFIPIIPFIPIIRDFFTFQYILEIRKHSNQS